MAYNIFHKNKRKTVILLVKVVGASLPHSRNFPQVRGNLFTYSEGDYQVPYPHPAIGCSVSYFDAATSKGGKQ